MKKFTTFFEEKFVPFATRIANQRHLLAVRDGIILTMPLMIVGSLFLIISDLPLNGYQNLMFNLFGEGWGSFVRRDVLVATLSIISLITSFTIAKSLVDSYGVDGTPAGVVSVSVFFIVNHVTTTADGQMAWATGQFGAAYLFLSIILSLLVGQMYVMFVKKNWVISLPDSVPPAIGKSFTALVPAAVGIVLALIIKAIFNITSFGSLAAFINFAVSRPLTLAGTSLGGALISEFVADFLWSFGIHGSSLVKAVMEPIWINASLENLAAFQEGAELPHIITVTFIENFLWIGGSGATLPLVVYMSAFARSKQAKQIGRLSIAPGIFNINESVTFGIPVVLNPFLMIPFVLGPLVILLIDYITMKAGIFPLTAGIVIPWTTPYFISGYLATGGKIGGVLLQIINFVVSFLIWLPFARAWDKQAYAQENAKTAKA